jgi:hypothetical protein
MGTRRLAALGAALMVAGVLAGCANGSPQPGGSPEPVASVSPSVGQQSPSPTPTGGLPSVSPLPSVSVPAKAGPSQPEQTITGQVEAGVERGCLILRDATGTYQLLGGDPTIVYAGANVSLTGHVVTGVMSYCMQGKPFQITRASRS